MSKKEGNAKERVYIFDTTLRDGEQAPGASMSIDEKIHIATLLENLGVDYIEAGFAASSAGNLEAITKIAKMVKKCGVVSLARTNRKDIDYAAQAVKFNERGRIHTFISTSKLHLEYQLKKTEAEVLELISDSVSYARNLCEDVEWSAMDASRSDFDFLCKAIELAIKSGARTINIPDTVGYSTPIALQDILRRIVNTVPNIDKAILSVHCHDDLGLAVANSLLALEEGVRQIECTINGVGERAGNCALEEIAMILKTRADILPYYTNINSEHIYNISKAVTVATGISVQKNKAIVGDNAFAHESGIHQDGMLKNRNTYEVIDPKSVGRLDTILTLGKLSGKHAFKNKIEELGISLTGEEMDEHFKRFKLLADSKKKIYDDDIIGLVHSQLQKLNRFTLTSLKANIDSANAIAQVEIKICDNKHQKTLIASYTAPTVIKSIFLGIEKATNLSFKLYSYEIRSVTEGSDAQGNITVTLENDIGKKFTGCASGTDILVTSANAYINALNKNEAKVLPTTSHV